MYRIATKVAQEILVLFEHHDIDAGPSEQEAEHDTGRAPARNTDLRGELRFAHAGNLTEEEAEAMSAEVPASLPGPHAQTPSGRPRARSLGIPFGGTPGRWNAITDVPGVEVGYTTLISGTSVRTGVTAIHPRGAGGAGDPVTAGFFSQNGNGEMTGVAWIEESGTFAGPVAVTNTHAVGIAHAATVAWAVRHHPRLAAAWLLPVVRETWDGYLNDINSPHVTEQACLDALESAASGPVEEGSVGGGTGMNCYEFKGGSGTASRLVPYAGTTFTTGVFVQANFGSRRELTLAGVPVGRLLADDNPMARTGHPGGAGSVIAIVGHRRAAAAAPVQGAGPPGHARPGPHRHRGVALLRRPVPGLLHRQPRARSPRRAAALRGDATGRYDQLRFIPWGCHGPVLRGRGGGHRGGRGQRAGGQRGHDRARRPPQSRAAARPGGRADRGSTERGWA